MVNFQNQKKQKKGKKHSEQNKNILKQNNINKNKLQYRSSKRIETKE